MYVLMGWVIVALLLIMTAPLYLRILNKHVFHSKSETYIKVVKAFRIVHKPLGLILLLIGFVHGFLALGSIRLHTGLLLWSSLVVTASLGAAFYKSKKKGFFTAHKRMLIVVICLLLLHLLFPGAIYYLFG